MSEQKDFFEWLQEAENLGVGTYEIEVAERLIVGCFGLSEPEVAIIRDTQNRILAVPEDKSSTTRENQLISRWDIQEGMKLRLTIDEKGISEVSIVKN